MSILSSSISFPETDSMWVKVNDTLINTLSEHDGFALRIKEQSDSSERYKVDFYVAKRGSLENYGELVVNKASYELLRNTAKDEWISVEFIDNQFDECHYFDAKVDSDVFDVDSALFLLCNGSKHQELF